MAGANKSQFARGMEVPFEPVTVLSPTVVYDEGPLELYCLVDTEDGAVARITFEHPDSVKVCRGEFLPFPSEDEPGRSFLHMVENSVWLRERHAYEAENYRGHYEWGGNVDEMLTDYHHYLLAFHDQFVEVIAKGIWFEQSSEPFQGNALPPDHPFADLPETATTERLVMDGITYQVRTNPKPLEEILWWARYCSQPLYHFALELDGSAKVVRRLDLREIQGLVHSLWRPSFHADEIIEGLVSLQEAKALIEPYVREVSARRRVMNK
jgi:hypothetical protein